MTLHVLNKGLVKSRRGESEPYFKIFGVTYFPMGKFFGPPKYFILFFSNILGMCGRGFAYFVILAFQKLYKDHINII